MKFMVTFLSLLAFGFTVQAQTRKTTDCSKVNNISVYRHTNKTGIKSAITGQVAILDNGVMEVLNKENDGDIIQLIQLAYSTQSNFCHSKTYKETGITEEYSVQRN